MICIYEDEGLAGLSPLVDLRPVFDLRCGRRTLLEKVQRFYPREKLVLWVREEMAAVVAEAHADCRVNADVKGGCLFLSGRAVFEQRVPVKGSDAALMSGDDVVGFRVRRCDWRPGSADFEIDLPVQQVKARVVTYPWQLVEFSPDELRREYGRRSQKPTARSQKPEYGRLSRGAVVVGPRSRLSLSRGSRVWPGVLISTESGPVTIDRDGEVRPGSFVEGPCYVGPGTVIDGAKVRPGCSFGPGCRVGGEVEASVFQGYANKHHDGFIGHSFVGEWVNLGAMTANSDLKNAYQEIEVTVGPRAVKTGLTKVGCFFGDHAKAAIGSLFNTGAVVGTCANWFEPGLSPKTIPAFSWGGKARWQLRDALATARKVMSRRGVEMSRAYERLLRFRFRQTSRS